MNPKTRRLHESTQQLNSLFSLLLIAGLLFTGCSSGDEKARNETPPPARTLEYTASVSFLNGDGSVASVIDAAVADDDRSRSEGFVDVCDLPERAGWLLIIAEGAARGSWRAD